MRSQGWISSGSVPEDVVGLTRQLERMLRLTDLKPIRWSESESKNRIPGQMLGLRTQAEIRYDRVSASFELVTNWLGEGKNGRDVSIVGLKVSIFAPYSNGFSPTRQTVGLQLQLKLSELQDLLRETFLSLEGHITEQEAVGHVRPPRVLILQMEFTQEMIEILLPGGV